MKNLFKNKSLYLGLAATFAVVAGLYFALPASVKVSDTDKTQVEESASTKSEGTVTKIQPKVEPTNENPVVPSQPAVNIDNVDEVDNVDEDESADKTDTDKI